MKSLYRLGTFLAAALLFLAEPLAARQLLPLFGGAAAVWITCLVFFQCALLAGYLSAHLLPRTGRAAPFIHLSLAIAAIAEALHWALAPTLPDAGNPLLRIPLTLAATLGLPFILLAATSPLLQHWQSRTTAQPWGLYALSNAASLLALLAYPTLFEPTLALSTQRTLWSAAFTLFAVLSACLAIQASAPGLASETRERNTTQSSRNPLWFFLSLAASVQLSAITQHLTTNIAAIPLLWILPLALYLLTFIAAFQSRFPIPRKSLAGTLVILLIAAGSFLAQPQFALPVPLALGLFLLELTAACLLLHAELFRLRPPAHTLTAFYLLIAAGGATGALLVGILAPLTFRANYDLSIAFVLTAVVAALTAPARLPRLALAAAVVFCAYFTLQLHTALQHDTLVAVRNFYGALRVTHSLTPQGYEARTLLHGTITHGTQLFPDQQSHDERPLPTAYYAPTSGAALALTACCSPNQPRSIGVVGLGAGTLAAYARPADTFRFYEINPAVPPIARNLFTYLRTAPGHLSIAEGDGRTLLAAEPPHHFDVLLLDAFSGDAIPLHLLTLEAIHIYRAQLAPDGILAFHISNQYLDLEPELRALATATGLEATAVTNLPDDATGAFRATWVLMTARPGLLQTLPNTHPLAATPAVPAWTDNHASLLRLLR